MIVAVIPLAAADWTTILSAVAVIFGLLGSGGALWAVFRASALEASNERLRKENEDYVRRLNYIEPKVEVLERENTTLRSTRDPSEKLEGISAQIGTLITHEQDNHTETITAVRDLTAAIRSTR